MKRLIHASVALLLAGSFLLMSACDNSPATQQKVLVCLGNIALKVVVNIVEGDEPLAVADALTVGPPCIDAAAAAFGPSSSSSSSSSSPTVSVSEASSDEISSGSVHSDTWSNCTDSSSTVQIDFYVPFEMVVGPQGAQDTFAQSPGEDQNGNNVIVARALFDKYNSTIADHTTDGPSTSTMITVPPYTQITLTLPITQHYIYGTARLVSDGNTSYQPWFFTNGFDQAGQITSSAQSC